MLKDILERAGSIGYTINIPACVENVLVDLGGPQVSGPVSRGNLQKRENFMKSTIEKKPQIFFTKILYLGFFSIEVLKVEFLRKKSTEIGILGAKIQIRFLRPQNFHAKNLEN